MSMYSLMFGQNRASGVLLSMLRLTAAEVGRFRDCFLQRAESGALEIVVYTRNGGGNREDYESVTSFLRAHPQYLRDQDDDFDCTYASYVFSVPEEFKADAEELSVFRGAP